MTKTAISQIKGSIIKKSFGFLLDGTEAHCYTLLNCNGCELSVMNYGATITSLKIPNSTGEKVDVVLGFDTVEAYSASYELPSPPYFGAVVGRFAGRINKGLLPLNGEEISLTTNWKGHQLHGGFEGFGRKFWNVTDISNDLNPSITFSYRSPDQDEQFPGEVSVKVTYTLTEKNELKVAFEATSTEDTPINLTQHSYFNLNGHQTDIKNQKLMLPSKKILETGIDLIPTGDFISLLGHPFDFSTSKDCPSSIDTTFVVDHRPAAVLFGEATKIKMTVSTNQPAVHIYVGGDCFHTIAGKEGVSYHSLSGICFETQNFPDAPNHSHFPTALLKKGEAYTHETTFLFEHY